MNKLGKNKDDQKRSNRGLIMKLIATKQCSSRIELANKTGLTKTAVSQIVSDLMKDGYLAESEKEKRMEHGRNPVRLVISPDAPKFVGILIERDYCAAVLCDLNLNILKQEKITKEWMSEEELMQAVFQLIDEMLEMEKNIGAIGAAAIGPVNVEAGLIVDPYFFHDIKNVEVRRILEKKYQIPVYFDHDNQSAVLAEFLYGNGREYQDILLIGVDRGVGSGIVSAGHRMHSSYGYAPEIGHISLDRHGIPCVCGNHGCLERYINSDVMMEKFRKATGRDLTYEEYMKLTDLPEMDQIMRECVENLSVGIISCLNLLNSQLVLLGMDCCYWPEKYFTMMEEQINRVKFGNKNTRTPVKKAYFSMNAQLYGAACNAMLWLYNGEIPRRV